MKKTILAAIMAVLFTMPLVAQRFVTDSVKIHFHCGRTGFDPALSGNAEAIRGILDRLADDGRDSLLTWHSVEFVGGASPEGSVRINEKLSRGRADRLFRKLEEYRSLPDSLRTFTYLGRDWHGLLSEVESDMNVPHRQEVLKLLHRIVDNNPPVVSPVLKLQKLCGGRPYMYLLKKIFPKLRAASMRITYRVVPRQEVVPEPEPPVVEPQPEPEVEPEPEPEEVVEEVVEEVAVEDVCKPFYMDLRTNMLYDAALLPTVGAEFYLGRNWSIGANWTYGWWKTDRHHRYWRAYGGELNVRRWLGQKASEKPLQGHHLGVYGQICTYDFEFGGKGQMGGKPGGDLWDKMHWGVGLEYGYSLPVGRRLNIDFSLGLGYMTGTYYEYKPVDNCYVWQATKTRHFFGPTKAEISLVWLIGCGNYNAKKQKGGDGL